MRNFFLALSLLFAASAAQAAPKIRIGAPYAEARASLIAQGFVPQHVTKRTFPTVCEYDDLACALYPELEWCWPMGAHGCTFLFRSREDGSFWQVLANGRLAAQRDLAGFKVGEYKRTTPEEDGVSIAGDAPLGSKSIPEPKFTEGAPYGAVRAALISQGFTPQSVTQRESRDCFTQALCKQYPELETCGTKQKTFCGFLFRGRPGFGWWRVITLVSDGSSSATPTLKTVSLHYKSDASLGRNNPRLTKSQ
jgi:hypothetical protein